MTAFSHYVSLPLKTKPSLKDEVDTDSDTSVLRESPFGNPEILLVILLALFILFNSCVEAIFSGEFPEDNFRSLFSIFMKL